MIRPISISLSPNTEKDDIRLAFSLLFRPWRWKDGKAIEELENEFKNYLGIKHAISFNSGRSAFLAILESLGLEKESEVLLQAFTCNAASNPIIWAGLKPIYVDVNENTYNIDTENLRQKITSKSKAVVVQHTFGLPADIDEVIRLCQENNLILIEDCAHSLGATYKGRKIGIFGKAAFFSFSRDKIISSVYGGMVTTNDDELAETLRQAQGKFGQPSYLWIKQQLLHPVLLNWLILPTYKIFGKYIFILLQELKILSKAVHVKEKRGEMPNYFPKRLPNALAELALSQLEKIGRFNSHRKEIANFYKKELKNSSLKLPVECEQVYLRFAIKHPQAHQVIRQAWDNNILLGDWYTTPIAPEYNKLDKLKYKKGNCLESEKFKKAQYLPGSCPVAEKLAKETLNLPTHINISKKEAQKIVDFLKKWKY